MQAEAATGRIARQALLYDDSPVMNPYLQPVWNTAAINYPIPPRMENYAVMGPDCYGLEPFTPVIPPYSLGFQVPPIAAYYISAYSATPLFNPAC